MVYERIKTSEFFRLIDTEEKARDLFWRTKCGEGRQFVCRNCGGEKFSGHLSRVEVRTCTKCWKQTRLRAGTVFENSKLPLLTWARAIYLVMQGKRGISAFELKRILGMKSYGTTWLMLMKIRKSLSQRDDTYKLSGIIELDGARFGKRKTKNQAPVLVAVETKKFIDDRGKSRTKAGFAKVMVAEEDRINSRLFVRENIQSKSTLNVDASLSFRKFHGLQVEWKQMNHDDKKLSEWLPWVHRFISNAKAWIVGTHHGVEAKHLPRYLAEYTYRFNRRHDPDSLFHRALKACTSATPITLYALSG